MERVNMSYEQRIERIRELKTEVDYIEEQWYLYHEYLNRGIAEDEYGNDVKHMITMYDRLWDRRLKQIKHHEEQLTALYNLEAFVYDCPVLLDESWYENQFKQKGYFIGIRL